LSPGITFFVVGLAALFAEYPGITFFVVGLAALFAEYPGITFFVIGLAALFNTEQRLFASPSLLLR